MKLSQHFNIFFLYYFRLLAKLQLKKYAPDIIGITGTAGKTSALYAAHALLKDKYRLKTSFKANSEWGIPLDILGLKPYRFKSTALNLIINFILAPIKLLTLWQPYEKYLVEMGVDGPESPQNMEYLLTILRPRTAIFLNVEPMHSEPFDHLVKIKNSAQRRQAIRKAIAAEKGKLITHLPVDTGLAILNADDDLVAAFALQTQAEVMTFGQAKTNDVQITSTHHSLAGTKFTFNATGSSATLHFKNYLLPSHYAYTFASALCLALDEGFSLEEGINLLQKNYSLPPGRATLIPGKKGSLILDSSYNSSARPVIDFLAMLQTLKGTKVFALLGDIRELGQESASEHEMVAHQAAAICDRVFLVGPNMNKYACPIIQASLGDKVSRHDNARDAAASILPHLKPGVILLIKGSQNTLFLEAAVEALMRHPDQADTLLCRRGSFWDQKRALAGL